MVDQAVFIVAESVFQISVGIRIIHKVVRRVRIIRTVIDDAAAIFPAVEGRLGGIARFAVPAGRALIIVVYRELSGKTVCFQRLRGVIGKALIGHTAAGCAVAVIANLVFDRRPVRMDRRCRGRRVGVAAATDDCFRVVRNGSPEVEHIAVAGRGRKLNAAELPVCVQRNDIPICGREVIDVRFIRIQTGR